MKCNPILHIQLPEVVQTIHRKKGGSPPEGGRVGIVVKKGDKKVTLYICHACMAMKCTWVSIFGFPKVPIKYYTV